VSVINNFTIVTLGGQRSSQSYRRHPRARPEGPCRDVALFTDLGVCLDHGMVPRISAVACPRMTLTGFVPAIVTLEISAAINSLSVVTLGLDPRAHAVMSHHS